MMPDFKATHVVRLGSQHDRPVRTVEVQLWCKKECAKGFWLFKDKHGNEYHVYRQDVLREIEKPGQPPRTSPVQHNEELKQP